MPAKREKTRKINPQATQRASVSFPPEIYRTLEQIAKQEKVSLAWIVRDAAERYVAEERKREDRGRGGR